MKSGFTFCFVLFSKNEYARTWVVNLGWACMNACFVDVMMRFHRLAVGVTCADSSRLNVLILA